jgi:cellulose synthase/poly-beta-1,6-N-acetylglucosamine synthase-like glycosyltransferase
VAVNSIRFLFWTSVFLVAYPFAVYPPAAVVLGWFRGRALRARPWEPTVTVLISAFNEADCIGATIQNKLRQRYPRDKLQIIVVSDASDDDTDDVVRGYAGDGVVLIRQKAREGKAAALNLGARQATGDIVIFSDANSMFDQDAVRHLVENFADPDVGYVSGSVKFESERSNLIGFALGVYRRYENLLRSAETRMGSSVSTNGGVGAVRRGLYAEIRPDLMTDFVLPLKVISMGYRSVFDARVQATESTNPDLRSEFGMRVRVALRTLQGLAHMRQLLNPLHYPLMSFCLVSHKAVRYAAFLFLASTLACNVELAPDSPLYRATLILQLAGYGLASLGLMGKLPVWLRRFTIVPSYLLLSYAAFAVATIKLLRGDRSATWEPRSG